MIFGDMHYYDQEKHTYPLAIRRGLEAIVNNDLTHAAAGKYEIEGQLLFALVQEMETGSVNKQRPESHEMYVDIQFLVSGEERIGVVKRSGELAVEEDKRDTSDIVFYKQQVDKESFILLKPGQFVVFYPSDVHRPCCRADKDKTSRIKKIVIKIHKQLWEPSPFLN